MATNPLYPESALTREELDESQGVVILEFGASWCGICQGAQPAIEAAFAEHGDVRHIKIADGKGKVLGRSFRVKLWPTLIALRDGREVARVVRPGDSQAVSALIADAGER